MRNRHILLLLLCMLAITSCTDQYGHLNELGVGILCGTIGAFLLIIWLLVVWNKAKREKEQAIEDALRERRDFTESKVIKGKGGNAYYLATDNTRKKIFYVFGDKKLLCDFKDVVSVDVIQDGEVLVSKTSVGRAVSGALLGGALGGDTGAILGALAFGSSSSQSQISKLNVHVLLRNQALSSIDFICYSNPGSAIPQLNYFIEYKEASERAQELYDLFRLVIDEADREMQINNQATKNAASAVQELKDLAELHKQGLIDADEYAKMKSKIIGND